MKKTIFGFALLTAALFAGCVKSDNSYKELQPVLPGMYIYSNAASQNDLALLPANAGMRFAVLLAEARKQGKSVTEVTDSDKHLLQSVMFGTSVSKIETATEENGLAAGDYRLTFRPEESFWGTFCLGGQLVVKTGGQLLEAGTAATWEIVPGPGFVANVLSQGDKQTLEFTEGSTTISSSGDGSYRVMLYNIRTNFTGSSCASDWSGSYRLRPDAPSLAYSDCHGKQFAAEGTFGGETIFSFNMDNMPTRMSYTLSNGIYFNSGNAYTGRVSCALTGYGDYPIASYPSPTVEVEWSMDESGRLSRVISYNGAIYSK